MIINYNYSYNLDLLLKRESLYGVGKYSEEFIGYKLIFCNGELVNMTDSCDIEIFKKFIDSKSIIISDFIKSKLD